MSIDWEDFSGRDDPAQRFRLYVLCLCGTCGGERTVDGIRCPECRGEGRGRDLKATAGSPEALGLALVTLAREGEFLDDEGEPCQVGVLDVMGEVGQKWLIRPWMPSPRNVSDAGRVLRAAQERR